MYDETKQKRFGFEPKTFDISKFIAAVEVLNSYR